MNRAILKLGTLAFVTSLLVACHSVHRHARRFDPRTPAASAVTNFTSVAATNIVRTELLNPPDEPFTLGPGDRLELEIFGDPNSRSTVTVGPDGKIYFYLLPGIDVWGLTLNQTKAVLERELGNLVNAPQVGIILRGIESKRVWLLGRLQNAGVYPISAPMTLLETVALAGGTATAPGTGDDFADLRRSFVVRQGQLLPVDFEQLLRQGDMSQNIYVRPDDFVYFPSALARQVYVLGAVQVPQAVNYSDQITVVSAMATAGGALKGGYLSHVAIVRGSLTEPQIAIVNYKDIIQGKATDARLEAGDILYVPWSPYRYLAKYANLIVETFVRAVAINEGARAASRTAVPVGVSINVGGVSGVGFGTGTSPRGTAR